LEAGDRSEQVRVSRPGSSIGPSTVKTDTRNEDPAYAYQVIEEDPMALRIVVTGGGTIAPIDDVRHITNFSTGRFSARITEACLRRGAEVWHIHAPSAELPFWGGARFDLDATDPRGEIDRVLALRSTWLSLRQRLHLVSLRTGTVSEYRSTLEDTLKGRAIDVAFLAMAVSDYEPEAFPGKIDSKSGTLTIVCRPTPKVIREVKSWSPGTYLVGFKLLSGSSVAELRLAALAACQATGADLTVANDYQSLRDGEHTIHLVRPGAPPESAAGGDAAEFLVDHVLSWSCKRGSA
jgi:phosphopantothenate-cysteine ligase